MTEFHKGDPVLVRARFVLPSAINGATVVVRGSDGKAYRVPAADLIPDEPRVGASGPDEPTPPVIYRPEVRRAADGLWLARYVGGGACIPVTGAFLTRSAAADVARRTADAANGRHASDWQPA